MRSAPRLLLTGFEPFGGDDCNPSQIAVEALAADPPPGCALATEILPVSYARATTALDAALRRHRPAIVLATGLAAGRSAISIERQAVNRDDAALADNDGVRRSGVKVLAQAPETYAATVPTAELAAAVAAAGVAVELSDDAGGFVCNHLFFQARHWAETRWDGRLQVGFIHLPLLPQQAQPARPGFPYPSHMTLETILYGLRAALAELCRLGAE
jgi:pyroglutamyl-peptidase